ncbi:hypothetical protein MKZ38_002399 [Zalerion maritima]|uniref:Uncharacterized protein n=1 Tax=Zalerion maritima TaxID=339359 RepID=A0AAD5WSJ1_9PEZI|nr:hypothetical protein MKZ38_002399 [Zalerion maritima]
MATTLKSIKSLVPLLDRVLVQRMKAEAKTASGIFLPESSVKELNEAKVLAVGPGGLDKDGKRMPMGVTSGDRVLIPQYGGSPVKVGEEEYQLFRDSESVWSCPSSIPCTLFQYHYISFSEMAPRSDRNAES